MRLIRYTGSEVHADVQACVKDLLDVLRRTGCDAARWRASHFASHSPPAPARTPPQTSRWTRGLRARAGLREGRDSMGDTGLEPVTSALSRRRSPS
jgi:hypothetical protein